MLLLSVALAGSRSALADVALNNQASGPFLTNPEIVAAFSDVLDRGQVQGGQGVMAKTRWYANGQFETQWWKSVEVDSTPDIQAVSGRWKAEGNRRCVLLDRAVTQSWQCGRLVRGARDIFYSFNSDGTLHGVHRLAPLALAVDGLH